MSQEPLLRSEASSERATFLELFFDLVFVFGLTRISARLIADFTLGHRNLLSGAGATLLLFLASWVVWLTTVWATSRLEPEARLVQNVVIITMVGAMVMAVAVPDGFGRRAPLFAVTLVVVEVGRTVYFVVATHGVPDLRQGTRVFIWYGLSAPLWLVGGLAADATLRGLLWSAAVLVDYTALVLGWPTPGLGRQRLGGELRAGAHLAERYQQFLLIALGEAIFVTGLAFSGGDFLPGQTGGFALALASTVLLWRIYFHRAGRLLPSAIGRSRDPTGLATDVAFTHLAMIAGIVLSGVGFELFITEPLGDARPAWLIAILGGPALFLAARAAFEFQIFSRVSASRTGGVLALGLLAPALLYLPPLAAGGGVTAVLLAIVYSDMRRSRGRPPESPAPPV
jgi:low temperature requirement protein LtrA